MIAVAVIASAAISALGRGQSATDAGRVSEPPRSALSREPALGLAHPFVGRAEVVAAGADRATTLLLLAARDLVRELERVLPDFRGRRARVLIGTSAGPMQAAQAAFAERAREGRSTRALAERAPYFSPLAELARELGVACETTQVLGACASSTLTIGLGCRLLDQGEAELVIAGGYDALSSFVAAGFESLGALTRTGPAPFRAERDGMALGEGAALVALVRRADAAPALGQILGFGASSDAVHQTAPDRTGSGVLAAAERALADAGLAPDSVDLVSAHATATPYNDAAESRALSRLFGSRPVPVHAFKAQIGHTLGAAGALETLAALSALERRAVPATLGRGPLDPGFSGELASVATPRALSTALKWSSAFGGLNAALVLASAGVPSSGQRTPRRPVFTRASSAIVRGLELERLRVLRPESAPLAERADPTTELALAAVTDLLSRSGHALSPNAAVVVGTAAATLEQNERFEARRREGRPVEPRRFPATSPSACAGFCSIVFGAHGPSFSVGSGSFAGREAFRVARLLVAAGDVDEALVIAVEDVGPVVSELFGAAGLAVPGRGAAAVLLTATGPGQPCDAEREPAASATVLDLR
jgi:3-oxoacyl-[acyl-carrier-protein] synthase-1/3-oxoacyl-[acyl-carrier-protein] synthase II